jgi:hypothetical protein
MSLKVTIVTHKILVEKKLVKGLMWLLVHNNNG